MDLRQCSSKDIGVLGERVAAEYLRRHGLTILDTNIRTTFGELDVVARSCACLHIVEVKALKCVEFPNEFALEAYGPGENLHERKIRKVARMAAWYVGRIGWEGEWQIDGTLVWLRERDALARVRHYPQIL